MHVNCWARNKVLLYIWLLTILQRNGIQITKLGHGYKILKTLVSTMAKWVTKVEASKILDDDLCHQLRPYTQQCSRKKYVTMDRVGRTPWYLWKIPNWLLKKEDLCNILFVALLHALTTRPNFEGEGFPQGRATMKCGFISPLDLLYTQHRVFRSTRLCTPRHNPRPSHRHSHNLFNYRNQTTKLLTKFRPNSSWIRSSAPQNLKKT